MHLAARAILLLSLALAICGCRVVEPNSASKSILTPLAVSPDAITLEVFSARIPQGEEQLDALWKLVDEQPLPADLRRRMNDNGFRAGVVGPNLPEELAQVLKVTQKAPDEKDAHKVSLNEELGVNLRVLHAKSGKRTELVIGSMREQLQVLEAFDSEVRGKTYHKAECRLVLKADYERDGRVRIELTPELHHGQFQSRVRGNDGMMMFTQERPKRVFHELQMVTTLTPGQMLLVTGRPNRTSSAGYQFFHDTRSDKPVPMLWVVRAARGAHDSAFYERPVNADLTDVSNDIEQITLAPPTQ
jgi:hypothetical protein